MAIFWGPWISNPCVCYSLRFCWAVHSRSSTRWVISRALLSGLGRLVSFWPQGLLFGPVGRISWSFIWSSRQLLCPMLLWPLSSCSCPLPIRSSRWGLLLSSKLYVINNVNNINKVEDMMPDTICSWIWSNFTWASKIKSSLGEFFCSTIVLVLSKFGAWLLHHCHVGLFHLQRWSLDIWCMYSKGAIWDLYLSSNFTALGCC